MDFANIAMMAGSSVVAVVAVFFLLAYLFNKFGPEKVEKGLTAANATIAFVQTVLEKLDKDPSKENDLEKFVRIGSVAAKYAEQVSKGYTGEDKNVYMKDIASKFAIVLYKKWKKLDTLTEEDNKLMEDMVELGVKMNKEAKGVIDTIVAGKNEEAKKN